MSRKKLLSSVTLLLLSIFVFSWDTFCDWDVEFKVNSYTSGHQQYPSSAMDANGNFVITWQSDGQDGSGYGIYAQRYDNLGNEIGSEFPVNTTKTLNQVLANIAMNDTGNFVISWAGSESNGTWGIFAQVFDSNGFKVGDEIHANTYIANDQSKPSTAMDKEGNFVITWHSDGQDGNQYGVYARMFDNTGQPKTGEFQVNKLYTQYAQKDPDIAMDGEGNFVITWACSFGSGGYIYARRFDSSGNPLDENEFMVSSVYSVLPSIAMNSAGNFVIAFITGWDYDGSGEGISAQRFDSNGNKIGSAFKVNTYTTNDQSEPSAAMDENSNFVIAWQSWLQDGSANGIYTQRYDKNGNKVGTEFRINDYTANYQTHPTAAMDADGNFIIAWQSYLQDGSHLGIYSQKYDKNGNKLGSEYHFSTEILDSQKEPSAAMSYSGDYVITWQSYEQDGSDYGIYAKRYDIDTNTIGAEFLVNTYEYLGAQQNPSVAMDADGDFVITWDESFEDIYAQRYDKDGNEVGSVKLVNSETLQYSQRYPSIAMDADGDFVITWMSELWDADGWAIYARRYSNNGNPLGPEFLVNTTETNDQVRPSIAMDADGDFVITWMSDYQNGYYWIYAQRFDKNGNKVGPEFPVNSYTSGSHYYPSAAMDADGDFVITWSNTDQDGSGYGVHAQRFDKNGNKVGPEFPVNSYTQNFQGAQSAAMDADGDFVITWESDNQDGSGRGVYAKKYQFFEPPPALVVDIVEPSDAFSVIRGEETTISALIKDNCGSVQSGVAATATFSNGDDSLTLVDDGTGADQTAGDGIYSAYWTPLIEGSCTITVTGTKDGFDTCSDSVSGETECKTLLADITKPSDNFSLTGGVETTISALIKDDCGNVQSGVAATATFSNGDDSLNLIDDGTGADQTPGDGIYSAYWTSLIAGSCTITVTGTKDGYDTGTDNVSGEIECKTLVVFITAPSNNASMTGGVETVIPVIIKDNCENVQVGVSAIATFNNGEAPLTLVDDGTGADGNAGDGVYTVFWTPSIEGSFTMTVTATKDGYDTGTDTISGETLCQSLVVDITMPWDNFNHYGGVQTTISSLIKDNCGNVQSEVAATATFSNGDESLNLVDDGTGADQTAGDGIYSVYWTPLIADSCTITVTGVKEGCSTGTDTVSGDVISSESYTPPGEDVEVEDTESGTSLTFDNVEVAGETTVNITEQGQGPPPPSGFKLHPAGMYYEINTTAEFNGMVEICINYDDTDLTPKKEEKLVLKVYEEGTWVPLTTTLLDTDANKICAETSHFSFFALTYDMSAEIVFTPSVFNLKSNGNYITCHIEMYDGYDVYDIDQTKDIVLEYDGNTVIAEESPRSINNNKLMVKFDRQAVFDLLSPDTYVDLTVKGTLTDGNYFEGTHNDIWVQD